MRTGNCSLQQGLTTEAANIVKQAITLAKRRGHAQVTPLHVANTMLSVTNGLLRTACLQSHSHPLQCKALELCFNVALNRLPATTSSPMLGSHHSQSQSQYPSISNALVAAFKRAQAHQRRGSIENQQQPLLTVKIELEQLIISILDDPSVSRVMREAGFNSTQVKTNVEQAVSLENPSSHVSGKSKENTNQTLSSHSQEKVSNKALVLDPIRVEDINSVVENLKMNQRKSIVVVGECVTNLEGVVKGVMEKFDKGDVDESLKGVKFISLSLCDFGNVSRLEVEEKVEELKGLAKKSFLGKGYVLYLGDLKWLFDYKKQQGISGYYCSIDHMVMEIGKLVNCVGECGKFWLMCVATFQAYMKCKNGHPSLETIWNLHPITIPTGSLRLSLITDSGLENESTNEKAENRTSWLLHEGVGDDQIIQKQQQQAACFAETSTKIEKEVRSLQRMSSCKSDSSSSSLPAWLQQYKNENKGITYNDQNVQVGELCKRWNSMCGSIQKQPYHCDDKILTLSSASPSSSTSGFSYEQQQHPNVSQSERNHHFWISQSGSKSNEPSNPNSTSSSDLMEMEQPNNFKELNLENMKTLCNALEKKVPWQKDIIPEIASTVLQCRSGLVKRKGKVRNNDDDAKEETWLFFQGVDLEAKEKIAKELARLVFGSYNNFISISLSSFASTRADSSEESKNKRSRDEASCSYIERFGDAMSSNPHRVFLVEDIEQVDYFSQLGFKRAIEKGRVLDSIGEEVGFCDAIIILSCETFSSRSRVCSPKERSTQEDKDDDDVNVATLEETSSYVSLDLNVSIDDDYNEDDQLVDEIGLLESVDRKILFKIQEL